MKKLISILLILIMIVTLVTVSNLSIRAVEKEYQYESSFDVYAKEHGYKNYTYEEIGGSDHWTLVFATCEGNACDKLIKGTFGDRTVINYDDGQPFTFGYGVYWKRVGFVPLTEVWNNPDFDGIQDMFRDYTDSVMTSDGSTVWLLGDTDRDGLLTILDVTHIQKQLAELEAEPSYDSLPQVAGVKFGADIKLLSDIDRDGMKTILDATWIQKRLASCIYNQKLECKTVANETSADSPLLREESGLIFSYEQLYEKRDTVSIFGDDFAQDILSRCDKTFFEDSVLLMYTDAESSPGYQRKNFRVYKDLYCEINFEQDMIYPSGAAPSVMTNRLILLSLDRKFIPECTSVNTFVYTKSPIDDTYLSVKLTDSFYTNAVAVDGDSVIWKESYNGNKAEMITNFDDMEQYGMLALISSRTQYEAFMSEYGNYQYQDLHPENPEDYGKELEDFYDDEFFEKYSLLIAVYRYVCGNYTTKIIATATQDNTLYVALRTTNIPDDPHAAAIYSHNISVNIVKETDVEDISSLGLLLMREED